MVNVDLLWGSLQPCRQNQKVGRNLGLSNSWRHDVCLVTWWRGGVASYVNSSWTHFDVERGRLKCYDTRPVTKIFWGFFLNLVNRSPNPTPLHPRPLITHTQMQSLQRQSDRTATLRIRVRIIEHVVCHTNSGCWGKFSKLTPPPSLPITLMGFRGISDKFSNDNTRELSVNCVIPRLVRAARAGGVQWDIICFFV